jgi:hypothetical protein
MPAAGLLLVPLLLALPRPAAAQVAVTYFPFQSVLGVDSNPERRLWAGVNAETNTFLSNVNLELHGMVNLHRAETVNAYLGLGLNTNPAAAINELPLLNGYTLTLGTRIKPLAANRQVQVVFELAPYANTHFDGGYLRTLLGLAYRFQRPN